MFLRLEGSRMILTWEGLALLAGWWVTTIGAALWLERRLARLESDVRWLTEMLTRRQRLNNG